MLIFIFVEIIITPYFSAKTFEGPTRIIKTRFKLCNVYIHIIYNYIRVIEIIHMYQLKGKTSHPYPD